jgi:hypothetical protein
MLLCEYVTFQCKIDFADMIKFKTLKRSDCQWVILVNTMESQVSYKREESQSKGKYNDRIKG